MTKSELIIFITIFCSSVTGAMHFEKHDLAEAIFSPLPAQNSGNLLDELIVSQLEKEEIPPASQSAAKPAKLKKKKCTVCGKLVVALARHMHTHTVQKPYSCSYPGCVREFIQSTHLTEHVRTHTGLRPYKCTYAGCHAMYNHAYSLHAHTRLVHEQSNLESSSTHARLAQPEKHYTWIAEENVELGFVAKKKRVALATSDPAALLPEQKEK